MAGYAMVPDFEVVEAEALPQGWSAQRVELRTLIGALELSQDWQVKTYTDIWCAFAILQVHGGLYNERGLLTAEGKGIKNQAEILKLLEVIWGLKEEGVIHCKGHQKRGDPVAKGNATPMQSPSRLPEGSRQTNQKSC